jgi:Inorganic pyrophosphatase/exopolyphosphatase
LYAYHNVEVPKAIAGLLLSAIISDTVLFKSPTCTPYDKKTAAKLAVIAGVNIEEYGLAMLKAGSGIGTMTPAEIAKLRSEGIPDRRLPYHRQPDFCYGHGGSDGAGGSAHQKHEQHL